MAIGLSALPWQARGLEPVDHRPIAELRYALSKQRAGAHRAGHAVAKTCASTQQTGEWTVSVVHDKADGSTLGKNLLPIIAPRAPTLINPSANA